MKVKLYESFNVKLLSFSRHYKYLNIIFNVLLAAVAGNKTKILNYIM